MEVQHSPGATYNVLHNVVDGDHDLKIPEELGEEYIDEEEYDEMDDHHSHKHKHEFKKETLESFDFNDCESYMWRKHQFRRYFQGKGKFWNASVSYSFEINFFFFGTV
jgi:hypothetical protein